MIKAGIIGCGHIADQHIRSLRSLRNVRPVAVCDVDRQQAKAFAARHEIPGVYEQADALLAEAAPDVVHILTPPRTHRDLSIRVLEANRNALIEKPFAENRQDAIDIVRAEESHAGTVSVCHNYLHLPAMQKALRLIDKGALGRIISAEVYWRISSLGANRPDAQQWVDTLPGGAFHEVGPHAIYLLRAVLGELQCVSAHRAGAGRGNDELRAQFTAGERLGALTISDVEAPVQKYLRIYGTRISLHVDLGSNVLIRFRTWGKGIPARALLNIDHAAQLITGTTANILRTLVGNMPRSHHAFIQSYYQRLSDGLPPPVSGKDGLAVTQILDQVWDTLE
jgi:predicted dehydrogenase